MSPILRKASIGWETEFFVLDHDGHIVNEADKLLRILKNEKFTHAHKEISKTMIELNSRPHRTVTETSVAFLDRLEDLLELVEKHSYHLLPLGTYPGKTIPKLNDTSWYKAKESVLGKENVLKEASICGYHFHYTLPERIVKKEHVKTIRRSPALDVFLNQYNFLIAADPAAITFCQSSPFWQGQHYAKDCRVLIYRDFTLNDSSSVRGIHYYLSLFGALPNYEFTLEDIRVMADRRKTEWIKLLQKQRFNKLVDIMAVPALKFMWGPVRVNKIGTFEYRGSDMNYPAYTMALAALFRYALEAIEVHNLEVAPSDLGTTRPFLLENNTIYIPPYSHVRHFEYLATVHGLGSITVYNYCKRLLTLVDKISERSKKSLFLKPIRNMILDKKTVSDDILGLARKNGYREGEHLSTDLANYLVLYYSNLLNKEIKHARNLIR